jgi:hypothetical protein
MSSYLETKLILSALRREQNAEAWQQECDQAKVNYDTLAVTAIVLGLAPQLHYALTKWNVTLPPRAMAKLGATFQLHEKRNAAIYDQLGEVLKECAKRELKPIALKGVHLAARVYPHIALRPMNDIDLLFDAGDLSLAEEMLEELGYAGKHKSSELGPGVTKHTSTFKREDDHTATPNPYLSTQSERMIEPHVSLEESWFGLKVDVTGGVRERAVTENLNGYECLVLSRGDLLLHLCVHFCFHLIMGSPAMVQLTDLLALTSQGGINWRVFVERAKQTESAHYAFAALKLAADLLHAPLTAEAASPDQNVLDDLARSIPRSLHHRLSQLNLNAVMKRTQQKPLRSIPQRIARGLSDRAQAASWAIGWGAWWRVWRSALNVARTDTGRQMIDLWRR